MSWIKQTYAMSMALTCRAACAAGASGFYFEFRAASPRAGENCSNFLQSSIVVLMWLSCAIGHWISHNTHGHLKRLHLPAKKGQKEKQWFATNAACASFAHDVHKSRTCCRLGRWYVILGTNARQCTADLNQRKMCSASRTKHGSH